MKVRPVVTGILALLGLGVSLYLLTVHWAWWQAVCLGVGNCELVNTSPYSEFLGIPVAILGALSYVVILVTSILIVREVYDDLARLAQFFMAAVGVAFSAYLTYIELYVLHEICPWCVLSAILISLIAILSGWELKSPSFAEAEPESSRRTT